MAAAAAILMVVSRQPWYLLHDEGSFTSWNAWTHWELSHAVALGMVAAGVHLAYRGRPEAHGAAWMAVIMLLGGVALVGWHWHHADAPNLKVAIYYAPDAFRGESPEKYRRRVDDYFAARQASLLALPPTRSAPQRGFYAGTGSLIVMGVAIARRLMRSQPSPAEAG